MAEDPTESGNPESEERPEWLPSNFKRPEDLAASYKEAERKINEETAARRNLEQILAQQQAELEQARVQAQQPEADPNEWYTAFEADPIATQKALAEQTFDQKFAQWQASQQQQSQAVQGSQAEIVAGLAYRELEDRHGKLTDDQRNEMARVATEYPHLIPPDSVTSPQKLAAALDIVYKLAVPTPDPQTNAADLQRAMKLNAQTATGAGGHLSTADENAQRWQEIQNASTGKLGL